MESPGRAVLMAAWSSEDVVMLRALENASEKRRVKRLNTAA
jgi:hypothetical protein